MRQRGKADIEGMNLSVPSPSGYSDKIKINKATFYFENILQAKIFLDEF